MKFVIVDLDNCIADDAWRIPHIRWQKRDLNHRYHAYHLLAGFDECANEDLFVPARDGREQLVVFTARPVMYRPITEEWLRRKNIPVVALLMRNDNDHRPSVELKRSMLLSLQELYSIPLSSVTAAYDDRADVVAMFTHHGIRAQVRAIHSVCAYTPPFPDPKETKLC